MLTSSRSKAYSARDTRLRGLLTWWSILEKSISIRSGSSIFRSSQGCQPPTMMTSKTFQSRIRMNLWLIGTHLLTLHLGSLLNVFCHKHPHRHIVWNKIRLWKESLFSAKILCHKVGIVILVWRKLMFLGVAIEILMPLQLRNSLRKVHLT